jgi:hypothetical protein
MKRADYCIIGAQIMVHGHLTLQNLRKPSTQSPDLKLPEIWFSDQTQLILP